MATPNPKNPVTIIFFQTELIWLDSSLLLLYRLCFLQKSSPFVCAGKQSAWLAFTDLLHLFFSFQKVSYLNHAIRIYSLSTVLCPSFRKHTFEAHIQSTTDLVLSRAMTDSILRRLRWMDSIHANDSQLQTWLQPVLSLHTTFSMTDFLHFRVFYLYSMMRMRF